MAGRRCVLTVELVPSLMFTLFTAPVVILITAAIYVQDRVIDNLCAKP